MFGYHRLTPSDVARWRQSGWITPDGEAAINDELFKSSMGVRLPGILAMLGVVLLGFAAMSFVAANWQDMPRLARLGIIGAGLWGSYGAAGYLQHRNMPAFANAAALLGVCIFGAGIMLIAQMYHIDGNPPDAVLTWGAGSFLAALAFRSKAILGLTMLLVGLWSAWESGLSEAAHWWFLPAWATVTAAILALRWESGLKLAATIATVWVVALGYLLPGGPHLWLVILIGLIVAGMAGAAQHAMPQWASEARTALQSGAIATFAGLFALQFIESPPLALLIVLAVITLALLIGAIAWGLRTNDRDILWLGYAAFSANILGLYFKTVGTLMGSSFFFLTVGVVVIALAWAAYRLNALRIEKTEAGQ